MITHTRRCGPLAVAVVAESAALADKVLDTLDLYNVDWARVAGGDADRECAVTVRVAAGDARASMVAGSYLSCARMNADMVDDGLYATCASGASATYDRRRAEWSFHVAGDPAAAPPDDVEDLTNLLLTTGWREAGWVPLHAGVVLRDARCALLAAASGGGKTTLVTALIRRRWQTLGDDKVLVRLDANGEPRLAALVHNFNLHPGVRRWFPEVGDLERLPRYSIGTEKRKVHINDLWPGRTATTGVPTHIVQVNRPATGDGIRVTPLPRGEALGILLRQTVIPNEPRTARAILTTLAGTARHLAALRLDIGADAYADANALAGLEEALRETAGKTESGT
jgi:hypothetical protein